MNNRNIKRAADASNEAGNIAVLDTATNSANTNTAVKFALSNDPRIKNAIEFRGTSLTDEQTLTKNPALCAFLLPLLGMPAKKADGKGDKGNGTFTTIMECVSFEPVRDKIRTQEVKYKDIKGDEKTLTTVKPIGKDADGTERMSEPRVIAKFKLTVGTKSGVEFVGNVPATFVLLAENSSDNTIQVQFKANWSGRMNSDDTEQINLWVNSVQ